MNGCLKGTYYSTNSKKCEDCVAGSFSDKDGATACRKCADGTYQNLRGKSSCIAPKDGSYCDPVKSTATYCDVKVCPPGTSCTKGIKTPCGVGKYQDLQGQSTCKICGTGTFQSVTGQTSCTKCSVVSICLE